MDKGADDAALAEYLARCLGKIHLCSVDRQNVGSGLASASEPVSVVNKCGDHRSGGVHISSTNKALLCPLLPQITLGNQPKPKFDVCFKPYYRFSTYTNRALEKPRGHGIQELPRSAHKGRRKRFTKQLRSLSLGLTTRVPGLPRPQ
jgi:hypothetical protein